MDDEENEDVTFVRTVTPEQMCKRRNVGKLKVLKCLKKYHTDKAIAATPEERQKWFNSCDLCIFCGSDMSRLHTRCHKCNKVLCFYCCTYLDKRESETAFLCEFCILAHEYVRCNGCKFYCKKHTITPDGMCSTK